MSASDDSLIVPAAKERGAFRCTRCNSYRLGVRLQAISGVPTVQVYCCECRNGMHATFPGTIIVEAPHDER